MSTLKHYLGAFTGRIACCRDWVGGGHYFTDNVRLQKKIESHVYFKTGRIVEVKEGHTLTREAPEKSTTVDFSGFKWAELSRYAKERGVSPFGKKKLQLIAELKALEEK